MNGGKERAGWPTEKDRAGFAPIRLNSRKLLPPSRHLSLKQAASSKRPTRGHEAPMDRACPQGTQALMTIDEVLSILRISRTTLWRHMKRGGIKSIRIGSRVLFEPAAVDEFITYCRQRGYIQ